MSALRGGGALAVRREAGSALITALLAIVVAGGAAALLAELARTTLERSRLDRDGVVAWYLAEAGLADTVATLPSGTTFTTDLAAHAGAGTPDPSPGTYGATLTDDRDDTPDDPRVDRNQRILVRVTAAGPAPTRRRLEAVLARAPQPYLPGAATLAGTVSNLTGDFRLDGRDAAVDAGCTMPGQALPRAGASLADGAAMPPAYDPGRIVGAPDVARHAAPDLTPLATDAGAVHADPMALPTVLGTAAAPQLTVIDGDATVDGTIVGGGALYATGHLRVSGTLEFTGIVAAAGGIEITSTGTLQVCGAVWAAGEPALEARGQGRVRASAEAIASRVAALPARPRVLAVRELF